MQEYKDDMVWIAITNGGLGPAIIESQTIADNGKLLDRDGLLDFVLGIGHGIYYDYKPIGKNVPLKPGESKKFLRIHKSLVNQPSSQRKEQYKKFLSLELEIKFRDLYGKRKIQNYKIGDIFPDLAKKYNWEPS